MSRDPLEKARTLVAALGDVGADVRLVGGLAVRAWVGSLARSSLDVDLVALTAEAHARVLEHLRTCGFALGESGGWWRGLRVSVDGREVVDLAGHPVVNPRTFDAMRLRAAPRAGDGLTVVGVDDLAYLKLCAGRDQDLVDLALLAAHARPSPSAIAAAARADDVERLVARTAIEARFSSERGLLSSTFEELLGRAASQEERTALDGFLHELAEEGL